MHHPWAVFWFGMMGSLFMGSIGVLSSIWAEKFDHNAAITNFVIAPLSLLSGTFYVIDNLAPLFQTISRLNPFFYIISGFRFGFLGRSDIGDTNTAVLHAALGLGVLNLALIALSYGLLKSGWRLKN
jgi:ABC-2 type transport system permease protein